VEVQPEHLLITVTTHRYAAPGARHAFISPTRHFATAEEALEAAGEFLDSFGVWEESHG
jgi:hypothetical protein